MRWRDFIGGRTATADKTPIAGFLKGWKTLFGAAGVLVTLLAGIVLPLPSSDQAQAGNITRFAVALLIGLLAIAMTRHSKRSDVRLWVTGGLCTLVAGLVMLGVYSNLRQQWVWPCGHGGVRARQTIVVAATRTAEGDLVYNLAKRQFGPNPTPTDMMDGAYPARYKLWNPGEVSVRTNVLATLYIGTVLLLSAATVSIVQGVSASGAFRRR
jgi:hypothetical protein